MWSFTVRPEDVGAVEMMASSMTFAPYGGDWFIFETPEGLRYMCCHGYPNGALHRDVEDSLRWRREQFDYVICCFPKRVAAAHPTLNVKGYWDCPTTWRLEGNQFLMWPKEQGLNAS